MDALHKLSTEEIQDCAKQLEAALESHAQWLARVNQTIICNLAPLPDDIAEDAHCKCYLGRWYHGSQHHILRQLPGFAELGEIHRQMHGQARAILLQARSGETVPRQEYGVLLDYVQALRQRIQSMNASFAQELGLFSKLTDKLFQYCAEGVLITDKSAAIINVNQSFCHITGYSKEDVIGKTPAILHSGRQGQSFYDVMWSALVKDGHWEGEVWNRRKNGEIYLEWLSISAVKNDQGDTTHYVGICSDITTVRENEQRLQHLAYNDSLTGLPNRALFQDRLQQIVARAARNKAMAAVMFLDLDRFKTINDTLGHKAGDALLIETARRLCSCVRKSDTVARLGGDEFTIILPDVVDVDGVSEVAEKIIDLVSIPYMLEGEEVSITTSIGISLYPFSGTSVEALTKAADIAMYEAKARGRNNYQFFRHAASKDITALFTLENELRHALDRNEFVLRYQPQVDTETGRITSVEALLRWRHPGRGELTPVEFLSLAEETGFIIPIGEWVIRQACAQNKTWQNLGLPAMRVAVNVSAQQLKHRNFAEKVAEILDDTGLDGDWLELEFTENALLQNRKEVLALLNQLKSIGVWLSIDNFGVGHTSLSYLTRFPINSVKIDKSFIRNITTNEEDAAVSKAIIALGNNIGLKVIAEGVEDPDQLRFLRANACKDAQGFFFSRPVPSDEIACLLRGGDCLLKTA